MSIVLYPLFIPTYGLALFCYAYAHRVIYMPTAWVWVAILGTFMLTCAIPLSAILVLMRKGRVKDIQIADASERKTPYLYTIFGFGCWCYLVMAILHAPQPLGFIAIGATIAITLVACINRYWKISAHLTGMGGLVGGIFSYYISIGAIPSSGILAVLFGITLILMYARLYLDAHTPAQVCAGWLVGICCTFVPYCVYLFYAA